MHLIVPLEIPEYCKDQDPVKRLQNREVNVIDWTQSSSKAKYFSKLCNKVEDELKLKRKAERESRDGKKMKKEPIVKEEPKEDFDTQFESDLKPLIKDEKKPTI